ncbi:hypothetical protein DPSP01_014186 [Paraphaeosphaeria sporulosa]
MFSLDDVLVSLFATEEAVEGLKEDDGDGCGDEVEDEVLKDFEKELNISADVLVLVFVAEAVNTGPEEKVEDESNSVVTGIGKDAEDNDDTVGLGLVEVEKRLRVGVRSSEVVSTPDETKLSDGGDDDEAEKLELALRDGFGDVWLSKDDSVGENSEVVSTVAEAVNALWLLVDVGADTEATKDEKNDEIRLARGVSVDVVLSRPGDGESGDVPDIEPVEELESTKELAVADEGATEEATTEEPAGIVLTVESVADSDTTAEPVTVEAIGATVEDRPEEPADEELVEEPSAVVGTPLGGLFDAITELTEGTAEEEDEWRGATGGSSPLSLHES